MNSKTNDVAARPIPPRASRGCRNRIRDPGTSNPSPISVAPAKLSAKSGPMIGTTRKCSAKYCSRWTAPTTSTAIAPRVRRIAASGRAVVRAAPPRRAAASSWTSSFRVAGSSVATSPGVVLGLDRPAVRADEVPAVSELVDVLALRLAGRARVGGVVVERVAVVGHLHVAVRALDRPQRSVLDAHASLRRSRCLERRPDGSAGAAAVALAALVLLEQVDTVPLPVDEIPAVELQRGRPTVRARNCFTAA